MIASRNFILAAACVVAAACSAAHAEVVIENTLQACVTMKPGKTSVQGAGLFLHTDWEVQKSTGECGCKSALVSYRVSMRGEVIASGVLSSLNRTGYDFLINPDAGVAYKDKYTLFVGCAN